MPSPTLYTITPLSAGRFYRTFYSMMTRQSSLPTYHAATSPAVATGPLKPAIQASPRLHKHKSVAFADEPTQMDSVLLQLAESNRLQVAKLDHLSRLTEDVLLLSHEHLKVERRQIALQARIFNSSIARNLDVDQGRSAPLAEVVNSKGLFPAQAGLTPLTTLSALLSLDSAALRSYLTFYGTAVPLCLIEPSVEKELGLYRFILSRIIGAYGCCGTSAADFGGLDA